MPSKICTKCKIEKDLNAYSVDHGTKDQLRHRCKNCRAKEAKDWQLKNLEKVSISSANYYKKNSEKTRNRILKNKYGISLQEYNLLLKKQDNKCASCFQLESAIDSRLGRIRALAVDHNHFTGKVRGLLCTGCNAAIGFIKENAVRAEQLAQYIRKTV